MGTLNQIVKGVSALDIGASPGGWTKVLAGHAAIDAVVAVDPAGLSLALSLSLSLTHTHTHTHTHTR
eukprot:COSAG03_NODE_5008_length_1365_cov_2.511848_2_plen_67_part_00